MYNYIPFPSLQTGVQPTVWWLRPEELGALQYLHEWSWWGSTGRWGDIFSFSILRKVVVEGAQVIVKGKGRHLFMASELTSRLVCVKDWIYQLMFTLGIWIKRPKLGALISLILYSLLMVDSVLYVFCNDLIQRLEALSRQQGMDMPKWILQYCIGNV